MFPEYRDLITSLKGKNARFDRLFDEHNKLDHEISRLEQDPITAGATEIDELKRKKLHLKDEIYQLLRQVAAEQ